MRLTDIKPYERNAKAHDEVQIRNVMKSIEDFGIVQPIVVDSNGTIIIGHCRYEAMKRLGLGNFSDDVVKVVELSEPQAEKLRLLDNKLNESDWDYDILKEVVPNVDFAGYELDFMLPEELNIEWKDDAETVGGDEHKKEKEFLECPFCHHRDVESFFKKVET